MANPKVVGPTAVWCSGCGGCVPCAMCAACLITPWPDTEAFGVAATVGIASLVGYF